MKPVLLPKNSLSLKSSLENEKQVLSLWKNNNVYHSVNQQKLANSFCLMDGPPYANGDVHLGHLLNKVCKDLVNKSQWFQGKQFQYTPGWDVYGLPLELKAEKEFGLSKTDPKFKKKCKNLGLKSAAKQRKSFQSFGVFGHWSTPYFTFNSNFETNKNELLLECLKNDWLEYKKYPVHHCPHCESSLAEAELEYLPSEKHNLYFKVNLNQELNQKPVFAVVWTTTPWTLPMNAGFAYHPDLVYEFCELENSVLVGYNLSDFLTKQNLNFEVVQTKTGSNLNFGTVVSVSSLFLNSTKKVEFYEAQFVSKTGTGFVHLAPAHGPEDFSSGQKNNLATHTFVMRNGKFSGSTLDTLYFTKASKVVVEQLKAQELYLFHNTEKENLAHCWRHKTPTFYLATEQVFLNLKKLRKDRNLDVLLKDKPHWEKLTEMLNRDEWCLSRQRVWGTPCSLLVKDNGLASVESQKYLSLLLSNKEGAQDYYQNLEKDGYHLLPDVLDVWFDSGNVNNTLLGATSSDLVVEGKDQYRGWFQSSVWMSVAKYGVLPFKEFLCHGFVLNTDKEKLSKSKGNAKSVADYQEKYGTDVLRLWAAHHKLGEDVVFSEEKLENLMTWYQRLRLTLRFLQSNLYDYSFNDYQRDLKKNLKLNDLHLKTLLDLNVLKQQVNSFYVHYDFKKATEGLYNFCENLSNFYLSVSKNWVYLSEENSEERKQTQFVYTHLLQNLLEMLYVVVPFLSEEVYQEYKKNSGQEKETVFLIKNEETVFMEPSLSWNNLLKLKTKLNVFLDTFKKNKELGSSLEAHVSLDKDSHDLLKDYQEFHLPYLLGVSKVSLNNENNQWVFENLKNNSFYKKDERSWEYRQYH